MLLQFLLEANMKAWTEYEKDMEQESRRGWMKAIGVSLVIVLLAVVLVILT
jgi:hypothetical protein